MLNLYNNQYSIVFIVLAIIRSQFSSKGLLYILYLYLVLSKKQLL